MAESEQTAKVLTTPCGVQVSWCRATRIEAGVSGRRHPAPSPKRLNGDQSSTVSVARPVPMRGDARRSSQWPARVNGDCARTQRRHCEARQGLDAFVRSLQGVACVRPHPQSATLHKRSHGRRPRRGLIALRVLPPRAGDSRGSESRPMCRRGPSRSGVLGGRRLFTSSLDVASARLRAAKGPKALIRGMPDQCLEPEPNRIGVGFGARRRLSLTQEALVNVESLLHPYDYRRRER
jgi:hypothetical protein